jgi:hypothetical protein
MDKFSYKIAMTVEATLLILLMSTFYVTSLIGNDSVFFHLRQLEFLFLHLSYSRARIFNKVDRSPIKAPDRDRLWENLKKKSTKIVHLV